MRKQLANLLVKLADKLYPEHMSMVPQIDNYKTGKIGMSYQIHSETIKSYCKNKKITYAQAMSILIGEAKDNIKSSIWAGVEKENAINTSVEFNRQGTLVSGWLNLYVKDIKRKKSVS